jgi:hypothetical protein
MTKGEKSRLKFEVLAQLLSVLSGKTGLSDFAQQNFYLSSSFPNSSGLENYVMCERLCFKACNIYLNLNYACFMCHDIIYVIHVHFMQIRIFEYVSPILFIMILLSCASRITC